MSHFTTFRLHSISEGSRGRNSKQELKWKVWRTAAHWLAPPRLLSLLSYVSHLPRGDTALRLAQPYQSSPYSLAYRPVCGGVNSPLRFLFPRSLDLCQVGNNQTAPC